jgi:hypothetical protein
VPPPSVPALHATACAGPMPPADAGEEGGEKMLRFNILCWFNIFFSKMLNKGLFSSAPVNAKKFCAKESYQFEVLNEVYLQNFLHGWVVNRETNLMMLINP